MKKFLIMASLVIGLTSCAIEDIPIISLDQTNYNVSAEGGELTIPVSSTGIDKVQVTYREDYYEWEVDPETGDRTPAEGWVEVVKIDEEITRALAQWESGIVLHIAPNDSGVERVAYVKLTSFNTSKTITITQFPPLSQPE